MSRGGIFECDENILMLDNDDDIKTLNMLKALNCTHTLKE